MHLVSTENCQTTAAEFSDTDDPTTFGACFHVLFEHVVEHCGDKTALKCANTALTFGQLNVLANRYARALVQHGIKHGDIIGVAMDRSANLVAVLLAVMKTGAAYVPVDPALPMERLNQMMDDACPKLLITSGHIMEAFTSWRSVCLTFDALLRTERSYLGCGNLNVAVQSDDLAYVMYTSGSTGRPKGVEVNHGNVSNLLLSMQKEPGCDETDRLLAITTVSFDMAVLELYLPLLCGATVVIAEGHEVRDTAALIRLMKFHDITIMQATPAMWQMLVDSGWHGQPRLKKILCGGEALPQPLADRLLACGDMMWNMYGPTEATVYASIWRVRRDHDVIIGNPITNGHLYVLDEKLSPVPLGHPGELYIGGAGVASGYRNNSELTRSRFLDDPFHDGSMYRTGDLARFLAPGNLTLIGRIDSQVKIRGNRIELGEIEAVISGHENISGAVVVCCDDRLVAYCVPTTGALSSGVGKEIALSRVIRPWLAERLPAYMVPALFVEMEAFPLTINGKVDRKALPDPLVAIQAQSDVKPATELEGQLLTIWSKVLGHDRIGINDNFFEVGGDSIRIVRVQRELERLLDRPIPSPKLFEHYTVKTLAVYLNSSPGIAGQGLIPGASRVDHTGDIAIISMACRLPGGTSTPEDFWELLERNGDAITDMPKDRWNVDTLYDVNPDAHGKSYCSRGGFVPSINSFDLSFFGISPREGRSLDPAQYMMLETCWEGFERAGYTMEQLRGSPTGVFIGTSNILAHQSLNPTSIRDLADLDGYTVTGSAGGTMSGRISYQMGLEGPAMTIDTACSSSLVATHLACNALRQGECDMAVSGGISLILNPGLHVEFSRLNGMSPDGRCRAFSADAQGTGWSEGSVVTILKRLSDAQRDGDQIHAVLRGSAVNHDGRSASLTAPSGPAQKRLIRTALAAARLQPDDIDYVEAHGTGTKLGDPIEATGLAEVFASRSTDVEPLWIGSAKSNIGHTQAAAGLVGLLKVILAIRHNTLPETLHVSQPTPAVDWQRVNMMPVLSKRPWSSQGSRLRRAGVSAFGIGGTNAHVIVEEPPRQIVGADDLKKSGRLPPTLPYLLSADTDAALSIQAKKLRQHISSNVDETNLEGVAYSLATTRNHFRRRKVLMAKDKAGLLKKLDSFTCSDAIRSPASDTVREPRLAMLFTGQGSQWPGMGKDLCDIYPIFHETLKEIAAQFTELELPLLDVMWASPGSTAATLLDRTDFVQPALFALEVALWRLWQSWGVKPDFVLGHSLGELVTAHVAGILSLPDACRLVAARGRLMQAQSGDYRMVSLEATATEVSKAVQQLSCIGRVDVAAYNTPTQTLISGDSDAVESITDLFSQQGRKTKTTVLGHAFHSHHLDDMLAEFRAVAETIQFNPPQLSIISALNGNIAKAGQLEQAEYWVRQVREPVRFSNGIQVLASHGVNIFLELGPQRVLCGMGAACLADDDKSNSIGWLPCLAPDKDGVLVLQRSVAELHVRHVPIDWPAYFRPFGCQRVELPTYAFQREDIVRVNTLPRGGSHGISATTSRAPQGEREHLEFEVVWHPVDTPNVYSGSTWGLLLPSDNSIWARRVTAALSQVGIRLVEVKQLSHAAKLDGLFCMWDSDDDVISQTQGFVPNALLQLQTAARAQFMPPLVWVTQYAVGTGTELDNQTMRLGAAPLWGLQRTARNEHPELQLRLVDLDDEETETLIASALMLHTEPECAVRQGRLLVPRMQRVGSVPMQLGKQRFIRSDGAVLITGGLGQLGAHIARWMANQLDIRDLVLTSRRGMKASGAAALVAELSNVGVRVTVIAGNTSNPDSVKSIMSLFSESRPLRGVIHAAGVSDSGVLSTMTPERCVTTLAPKVYGAWLLHQATQSMDLDLFVMLSSISGIMGMPGLANYAAANTFLDAVAHLRRSQHLPGTAVAYGTWAGDGMASRLNETTRSYLNYFGLDPLMPETGLELFQQAVLSKRALTVAAALDLRRLQSYFDERGGIPPLLRSLLDDRSNQASRVWSMHKALSEAEPEKHADIVLEMVRGVVSKALGFAHPLDVDVDRPLQDIGIDSLTAVQMRNHLATLTALTLSVNIAFLFPNLRALSEFLLSQLRDTDASSTTSADSNDTSATTVSDTPVLDMAVLRRGCLDSSFTFDNVKQDSTRRFTRPESVFLTGATGFVGASILYELLKQGISVHCLVRADSVNTAWERLKSTLENYELWESNFVTLIEPVMGDLAQPLLGLTEEDFDDLADRVDAICHSGGLVDWMRPLDDYIGPNIVSAHEILRLASHGCAKAVHLISTISTLPKHMGLDLTEKDQEYGYGTSKYVAERLVAAARWRGAAASVYRLPYVTASTKTGHFRLDRGDFLHNFIAGSLEMGAFPSLDADVSAVLPVDYLSKTIVAVMTQDSHRVGLDFDFLNARAPTCDEFFKLVGVAGGGKEMMPFSAWKQRALDYAFAHPTSSIARIAAVLDGYTEETAAGIFKGLPVGKIVLGSSDYPAPLVDESFIKAYSARMNGGGAENTKST